MQSGLGVPYDSGSEQEGEDFSPGSHRKEERVRETERAAKVGRPNQGEHGMMDTDPCLLPSPFPNKNESPGTGSPFCGSLREAAHSVA